MKYIYVLFEFKHAEFFYFSRRLFAKNHTLSSWCRIFISRSRSRQIRIWSISSFLFIVVIVISILLKTAFWQTSIHSLSLVKILWRSDKDKTTQGHFEKEKVKLNSPNLGLIRRIIFEQMHSCSWRRSDES